MQATRLPLLYMIVLVVATLGSTINPKLRGVYKINEVDSEDKTEVDQYQRAELVSKLLRIARLLKKNQERGEKSRPLNEVKTDEEQLDEPNPSRAERKNSRDDPFLVDHQANSLFKMSAAFRSRRCHYGRSHKCVLPGKRSEVPNAKVAPYNEFGNNDDTKLDLLLRDVQ